MQSPRLRKKLFPRVGGEPGNREPAPQPHDVMCRVQMTFDLFFFWSVNTEASIMQKSEDQRTIQSALGPSAADRVEKLLLKYKVKRAA